MDSSEAIFGGTSPSSRKLEKFECSTWTPCLAQQPQATGKKSNKVTKQKSYSTPHGLQPSQNTFLRWLHRNCSFMVMSHFYLLSLSSFFDPYNVPEYSHRCGDCRFTSTQKSQRTLDNWGKRVKGENWPHQERTQSRYLRMWLFTIIASLISIADLVYLLFTETKTNPSPFSLPPHYFQAIRLIWMAFITAVFCNRKSWNLLAYQKHTNFYTSLSN